MRYLAVTLCLFFTTSMLAQVGIGNIDPKATVDISASNVSSPSNEDGILIPRVDDFPATDPTIDQDGMMLFITGAGTPSKGFYYWDQGTTGWVSVGGGLDTQNTLDEAYDEGGAGLGRTIVADNGALSIQGNDGIEVTGTFGSGATIVPSGAGTRMFFNPSKAAFRAGNVTSTQWNDGNVGDYSVAMGRSTTASGIYDVAIGFGSTASGSYSTALGWANTATAAYAMSLGQDSNATGWSSTALGRSSTASGSQSMIFGHNSSITGTRAIGIGNYLESPSGYEITIGHYNTLYTPNSTAGIDSADRLFSIGNGTSGAARSNALTIFKDGTFNINDSYNLPLTDGTAGQVLTTDGTGQLSFASVSGGDTDWTVTGNDQYAANTGNVGIGDTTPDYKLDLEYAGTLDRAFNIDYQNTAGTGIAQGLNVTAQSNSTGFVWGANVELINTNSSSESIGVRATNNSGASNKFGITGSAVGAGTQNIGISAWARLATTNYGGYFSADLGGTTNYGIMAIAENGSGANWAGYFGDTASSGSGNVFVNDNLRVDGQLAIDPTGTGYTFPTADGTAGQVLTTDGAGQLSFVAATGVQRINDLIDGKSDDDGTDDGSSVFLGLGAGQNDDSTNNYNVGVGYQSTITNTSGHSNSALGYQSLYDNTTGDYNVALGYQSLYDNSSGGYNVAIGRRSLYNNELGSNNTAIGSETLYSATNFANFNVALGSAAGYSNGSGSYNVFIGYNAGYNETGGHKLYVESTNADANNALIYGEFDNDILRTNSEFQIGNPTGTGYAFPTIDGANGQVLTTNGAGQISFTSGNEWSLAGNAGTNSAINFIGTTDNQALSFRVNNSNKLRITNKGQLEIFNTSNSVYIGELAGASYILGSALNNTAVGHSSLNSLTTGDNNTAMGSYSMESTTSGFQNAAFGYFSLNQNTTGRDNVANGNFSLYSNTNGVNNVAVGSGAMDSNTGGSNNVGLGYNALQGNTFGNGNVGIGNSAGSSTTIGDYNVFLGYNAGFNETGDHKLYIENTNGNWDSALIYGEFDNDILRTNSEFQIGNPTGTGYAFPTTDGTSGQVLTTNGAGQLSFTTATGESSTASNGLTEVADDIQLGGNLTQNTTLTQGNFDTTFNLDGTGDFIIEDNGTSSLVVNDSGNVLAVNNVGIGNSIPDGRLDIIHNSTGSSSPHIMLTAENANAGTRITFDNAVETNNNWVLFARADDDVNGGTFNIFSSEISSNVLRLDSDGKVGIMRNPVTNALEVEGEASKTTSGSFAANSDRRLKRNIKSIAGETALDKIEKMRGVTYLWDDDKTGVKRPSHLQYGFIAQELMEVFPEKVSKDNLGYYQTAYGDYDPIFVEAIKELKSEVDRLKIENTQLKEAMQRIEALEAKLNSLPLNVNN